MAEQIGGLGVHAVGSYECGISLRELTFWASERVVARPRRMQGLTSRLVVLAQSLRAPRTTTGLAAPAK